jgi:prepilin-type processing-associated H-X9-DG protein
MGINSCFGDEDDFLGADVVEKEIGRPAMQAECMAGNKWASAQSVVRSRHPGGAHAGMADGSVRFLSDYIDIGRVATGEFLGDNPSDILETNFGVWQRLIVSSDGFSFALPD